MAKEPITVGSKPFTESYILGEIIAQTIEKVGETSVIRKFGLGGTGLIYSALTNGSIGMYPEYTGTLSRVLLHNPNPMSIEQIQAQIKNKNLISTKSLGFNNTYALTMRKSTANRLGIKKISDLTQHLGSIKVIFDREFSNRKDGYPGLKKTYQLYFKNITEMEHSLAYEAIKNNKADLIVGYSTDAKIQRFELLVLQDNKNFFPTYNAVILAKKQIFDQYPKTWAALKKLENSITEEKMRALNSMVETDKKKFSEAASFFLNQELTKKDSLIFWHNIWKYTKQHSFLVFVSLFFSIAVALPLGLLAVKNPWLAQFILVSSGLLQTIPSLALLCLLIPILGIGLIPALFTLFLYGLLPIVQNTYTGLFTIDPKLIESAKSIGLSGSHRLLLIDLPLASPAIMAGIKTSAIINVGTATLAAFIGAGGYGVPIVTGLALNNTNTILSGAIPAAIFALFIHGLFELIDKVITPKGLNIKS